MAKTRSAHKFKLSTRGRLFVFYVSATLIGSFFLAGWLAERDALDRMEESLVEEVLLGNRAAAWDISSEIARKIESRGSVDAAREDTQLLVLEASKGDAPQIFVLDAEARVLAHPRKDFWDSRSDLGWIEIASADDRHRVKLRDLALRWESMDGVYKSIQGPQGHLLMSALPLPEPGLLVVATQPKARVDRRVAEVRGQIGRVRTVLVGVAFLLVFPGVLLLTWWYEQRLQRKVAVLEWVTRELDKRTTELQERNQVIEDRNRQIEGLAGVREEYMGILAHDFRSPLTNIRMASELLLQGTVGPLGEKARSLVETVLDNGKQLTDLADDVLDLGRLEAGAEGLDREPVDVVRLVRETMRSHVFLAESRNLKLEWAGPGELPAVLWDKDKMRQVLNNLVSNALKFSVEGGKVLVGAQADGDKTHVMVVDNGRGIPKDALTRIFDKYAQVKFRKEQGGGREGTGLGLAICKKIVDLHGGRIWAESRGPGKGSTFHVLMPNGTTVPVPTAAVAIED